MISNTQWYMVTNHQNLSVMLAQGLILPRSGFNHKFYHDPLAAYPGYIPLFCDPVPTPAIDMATQEKSIALTPVVAQVILDGMSGPVAAVDHQGRLIPEMSYPDGLSGQESVLLVPAPLPITCLGILYFETQASIKTFKQDIQAYRDVCLDNLTLKSSKKTFKHGPGDASDLLITPWDQAGKLDRQVPIDRARAAGGLMGLVFDLADKNRQALPAFGRAFGKNGKADDAGSKPGLTDRPLAWLISKAQPDPDLSLTEKMFWGMSLAIADKTVMPGANARDRALDFLKNQCVQWPAVASDPRLKAPLDRLTRDLDDLDRGTSDYTRSQLFDRHEKPFARAVILFFLHRDRPGIIESDHERLTPEDLLAANVLAGVHNGWTNLPMAIKGGACLEAAVTHRMAALSHLLCGSGIDLGPAPEPPVPFTALFGTPDDGEKWTNLQQKAALTLARELKWDCISTIISLGNGDYKLRSTPQGVAIVLEGVEKSISHDIHREKFFKALDSTVIPEKIYGQVRTILKHPR